MYVRDVFAARYRWVVLAAGTLAQASFSASSVGLPALSPTLKSEYELSLTQTGVVLAAVGVGMLFTLLPWGLVADRVDERWVIATGLAGAAALLVVASRTHTFGAVTGALVGVGALGASVNAASGRAIMAWFPSTELGLALGIRQTAIPIGGALGAAVLPVLGSSDGTRTAFIFLAAACLTGAVIAAVFIRGAAAAAEAAGAARTGAALGFQQTLLGVVVAGAPPVVAAVAAHSWRLAFFLAAAGPAVGVVVLQRLREPVRGRRLARTRGTSASLPAARRTPD